MKTAWLVLPLCFGMLQGCSQGSGNQAPGPQAGLQAGNPAQQQSPRSQQLFMASRDAMTQAQQARLANNKTLDAKKTQECLDLLAQAVEAARVEKNFAAAILCSETQARVKRANKDNAGAIDILEKTIKTFEDPSLNSAATVRLDESKALLASIYAVSSKPDKAEALLKQSLSVAQSASPVNHQRLAFWYRNYADFYKYEKKTKQSQAMTAAASAELSKDANIRRMNSGARAQNAAPPVSGGPSPQERTR